MSLTIWNYAMLYLFIVSLIFYQKLLNWLFGHYITSTTLFGEENFFNGEKIHHYVIHIVTDTTYHI